MHIKPNKFAASISALKQVEEEILSREVLPDGLLLIDRHTRYSMISFTIESSIHDPLTLKSSKGKGVLS